MVFNVVPTFLEVTMVAGILAYRCGPAFAALTAGTIVAYTAFTFAVTAVRESANSTSYEGAESQAGQWCRIRDVCHAAYPDGSTVAITRLLRLSHL